MTKYRQSTIRNTMCVGNNLSFRYITIPVQEEPRDSFDSLDDQLNSGESDLLYFAEKSKLGDLPK